jgi:plastocyanin
VYWNVAGLLAALLLPVTIIAAPSAPASGDGTDRIASAPGVVAPRAVEPAPRASVFQQAGVIDGVLRTPPRPQRRTVNRYGAAPSVARVQAIPPVVFLVGRVGPAPEPATDAVMAQQDTAFVPSLLVVPAGTNVRFPNHDPFFHNVFSYSVGGRFDLGRYPMDESKAVTFDSPGIVKVYCEVHESMRAAIVVVENGFWAEPGEDGGFRFEGVPPGTYTLVAWQADRGEVEREVVVPAEGTVRVELEL